MEEKQNKSLGEENESIHRFFKLRSSIAGSGLVGKNHSPLGKCEVLVYLIKYELSVQMVSQ